MLTKLDRIFLRLAGITLVFLYLVIIAGSVVRATGSGMGCPDWPKCFGYFIPPTDPTQVEFHPGHEYKKGMMIIAGDTLWRATNDFTSGNAFEKTNWEKYPAHNYAKFYVAHTWTEYINRLVGAASSFFMTLLLITALLRIKEDKVTFFSLVAGMCVLAFVVWLGKVVVDTNLKPLSITLHMMSALVLVSITIYTSTRVRIKTGVLKKHPVTFKAQLLLYAALSLTFTQVIFGTQVRQQIDTLNENMGGNFRGTWIARLDSMYVVHQLTALLVVLLNFWLFRLVSRSAPYGRTRALNVAMLTLILIEYCAGVLLHNFALPVFLQPVHLVLAMIIFGIQFALLVRTEQVK
jgi:heme a synthase